MKHLNKFNESTISHKFTTVDFSGGGDGVTALYIDGELFKYGDYYHDKIEVSIESFIKGVKWAGVNIETEKVECSDSDMIEKISELAEIPPKKLEDVKI